MNTFSLLKGRSVDIYQRAQSFIMRTEMASITGPEIWSSAKIKATTSCFTGGSEHTMLAAMQHGLSVGTANYGTHLINSILGILRKAVTMPITENVIARLRMAEVG